MNRVEALRALIEKVEAGVALPVETFALPLHEMWKAAWDAFHHDSLDAAARLEAPLRERGWRFFISNPRIGNDGVDVNLREPRSEIGGFPTVSAYGRTEARARLLAVLKAKLWEAEREPGADREGR